MKSQLDEIVASPPLVKQEGASWVVIWPEYRFGATILKDGTIGQFVAGFQLQDVEKKLFQLAELLVKDGKPSTADKTVLL